MGQVIAGPYCGQVLGDLGADVIKVEPPGVGDVLRQWGRVHDDHGDSAWWRVTGRNKRSVTVDLRRPAGQDLVRRLIEKADILTENFRPGTLERWGLGWDILAEVNPRLILVRVSGFGQDGPYAERAGYAAVGEAMGGLRALTGYPDRPPVRVGISIGDSLAGLTAAMGAVAALEARHRTGRGQVVDASIFESVLAMTEALVPEWHVAGLKRERTGASLPGIAPSNVYPTSDAQVLIAGNQDSVFRRLCEVIGRPDLASDPRYATHGSRGDNSEELDALIAAWTRERTSADVLEPLHAAGVPAGLIYEPADMLDDPHFQARQSIVHFPDREFGEVAMPAVVPRLSATPGGVRSAAPRLGEHTDEVLTEVLGLSPEAIRALREAQVV